MLAKPEKEENVSLTLVSFVLKKFIILIRLKIWMSSSEADNCHITAGDTDRESTASDKKKKKKKDKVCI